MPVVPFIQANGVRSASSAELNGSTAILRDEDPSSLFQPDLYPDHRVTAICPSVLGECSPGCTSSLEDF